MDAAARRGRTPGGRRIYVTEFGFQSDPPDTTVGVSLSQQAQFINESDRLLYSDRRVAAVGQYELTDVPQEDQFNTGLRFVRGAQKPAYAAYRVPIVVTRRSANSVEVYGQVRPARLLAAGPQTQIAIQASANGGAYTTVQEPTTNSRGIFRVNVSRSGAASARWRLVVAEPGDGRVPHQPGGTSRQAPAVLPGARPSSRASTCRAARGTARRAGRRAQPRSAGCAAARR